MATFVGGAAGGGGAAVVCTGGAPVGSTGPLGLNGCCCGGYSAVSVAGYFAGLWRVVGGGGSSEHEASKKAAKSASDNENFISVKTDAIVSGVRFVAND